MTCTNPACEPIEQIRGQMKPGDYYDVIVSNRKQVMGSISDPELYGYQIEDGQEVPEGIRSMRMLIVQRALRPLPVLTYFITVMPQSLYPVATS